MSSTSESASVVSSDSTDSFFHDDDFLEELDRLFTSDLDGRVTGVGDSIAEDLFPDEAFGFPINDQFVKNFCGSFLPPSKLFDPDNFKTEQDTVLFLNRMVTTIAFFLKSTMKTSLVPLRYFSDEKAPMVDGRFGKVKPDIIVTPPSSTVAFEKDPSTGRMSNPSLKLLENRSALAGWPKKCQLKAT
jgi:hypothetical protein